MVRRHPIPPARSGPLVGLLLLGCLVPGLPPGHGGEASAQSVLDRTPNLEGGWVGAPGTVHFNVLHRFWRVGPGTDDKLVNSPTMVVAVPLPGRSLVVARLASNSLVAGNRFNEWEFLARWAPFGDPGAGRGAGAAASESARPLHVALTAGWNAAARSLEGEVAAGVTLPVPDGFPFEGVRLLGGFRGHEDALGLGERGWSVGGGGVVRISDGVSIAADVGTLRTEDGSVGRTWGAGLQLRIPTTPHTMSIQGTNTRTGTLQGSAVPRRTVWGFEFTVPLVLARYLPRLRNPPSSGEAGHRGVPVEGGRVEVTMTEDMRFAPDTLTIEAGTLVTWRNTSQVVHTVTAHPDRVRDPVQVALPDGADPFDSGNMFPGESFAWRFEVPGTYRYVCVPHDRMPMEGVVVVLPADSYHSRGG